LISWKVPENEYTATKKVTLRTLLSHSAGFTDDYGFAGYAPGSVLPSTQQILEAGKPANNRKKLAPGSVPGTVEKYSGGGYIIIQQLIEDITHKKFRDYADSVVIKKLQMTSTTYDYYPDKDLGKTIARGHGGDGKAYTKKKYHVYPEMAAAGPWTNVSDVAKLVMEIQEEKAGRSVLILNQSLINEMLRPQINTMGLGPHLLGAASPLAFWHAGNTEGYVCLVYGTATGQGAVVMTNSDGGEWLSLEIIRSIANAYHWPVMQTKVAMTLTDADIVAYTGDYRGATNATVAIVKGKNGLVLNNNHPQKQSFELIALADGTFTIKDVQDKFSLVFERDATGQVKGIRIMQNGGKNMAMEKLK
jgi:CubicO group peptidase (beta-lactamase class C family)